MGRGQDSLSEKVKVRRKLGKQISPTQSSAPRGARPSSSVRSLGPGKRPEGPTTGPRPVLLPSARLGLRPKSGARGEGRSRGPVPPELLVPAWVWGDFRTRTAP